ncbi:MAG: Gldg family protein [Myxococcota bacterium]
MAVGEAQARADRFDRWSFAALLAGWVSLLLGQRVFVDDGAAKLFTLVAVALIALSFGQRVFAAVQAPADRRGAARAFAALAGASLLALGLYFATTEAGRELTGMTPPEFNEPDTFDQVVTVTWLILMVASLLATTFGELSRRSMTRAAVMESRRVFAAIVSGLSLALAAAYAALFTYGASEVDWSYDVSYFRVAAPGESTVNMLAQLETPLTVRAYFPPSSEVRPKVTRYFKDLIAQGGNLAFEVHDQLAVPQLAKEDEVKKDGVVVLVNEPNREQLDIGVTDKRALRKLRKFDGEFQKSLMKVMRSQRTAYLTVGHGELNEATDRRTGRTVRILREALQSQNYAIKDLGLSQGLADEVPDDATMVLVLGPQKALNEAEVESLRRFAEGGGAVFLALDPDDEGDHAPLAAALGVKWERGLVVNDRVLVPRKRDVSDKKNIVSKRFSSHASVSTLSKASARGAAVLFLGVAPLDKLPDADPTLKVDFAVKGPPGSYLDQNANWRHDKDTEKQAIFNLAAAVTGSVAPSGEDANPAATSAAGAPEMRAFIVGDAGAFADDAMSFATTNQLLFLDAVRWLGGEESFSGAVSQEEDERIVHTKEQDQLWFYSTILGMPSLLLGLGLVVTRRQRGASAPKRRKEPEAAGEAPSSDEEGDSSSDESRPAGGERVARGEKEPSAVEDEDDGDGGGEAEGGDDGAGDEEEDDR